MTLMNHLKIQKGEANLKPNTSINYLKNENSVEDFIIALEDKTIKYGCIQSLDLLKTDLNNKISQAMIHKLAAYLPTSVVKIINEQT